VSGVPRPLVTTLVFLACAAVAAARAQGEDPPPIVVSAPSYELVIPDAYLHPGSEFDLVVYVSNESDRPVLVWSEDITDAFAMQTGGYLTVVDGPLSEAGATEIPAGALDRPVTFRVAAAASLAVEDAGLTPAVVFTLQVVGVLP